jgi:hypothetical protein
MSRIVSRDAVLAIAAALLVGLVAVLTNREPPERIDSYASDDYASGGYSAFAALLEREGVRTQAFVLRPAELDAATDTLVSAQPLPFSERAAPRTPAELADVAAWVRRGGRLVYIGRNRGGDLAGLERERLALPSQRVVAGPRGSGFTGSFAPLVRRLDGLGNARLIVTPRRDVETLLADRLGAIAVRYPLGRGEVLALADPTPFVNGRLAHADDARFAYLIARPRAAGGTVAFDESLHGLLRDRPWYLALTPGQRAGAAFAGLALVLGLIGATLRGGAPVRLTAEREPTSAEFVAALAALRARTGAREATREALAAGVAAVARATGGRADLTALDVAVTTDDQLLASAKLAYSLRKELRHGRTSDGRRAAFARRTRTDRRR